MTDTLPNNGHIVIIGGGPGGTACALALQRFAAEAGRAVQITLLEGKQFRDERHYNQCVGVLSSPLPALMEGQLDLAFPKHLCLVEIDGYFLHSAGDQIFLESDVEVSFAVRRVQFDAYMLDAVIASGISVLQARAVDIEFHQDTVVVYTENSSITADAVVGAFGMDEGSSAIFKRATPYRPPQALDSIVTKYQPSAENMHCFGKSIHAFLPSHPKIEFGAVTPKCDHLTINIAGSTINAPLMNSFLNQVEVCSVLPDFEIIKNSAYESISFFKGRFPRSLAHNYYGDRYVMVGDASGLVRVFKGKGVTTAVMTGIRAAETIVKHGISKAAFHDSYRVMNRDITDDLPYGRIIRLVAINLARFGLMDQIVRAAKYSPSLRSALFDAVSAHAPFKQVILRSLQQSTVRSVLQAIFHKPPN